MFEITTLKDTIPIHPSDFGLPPEQALIAELNKKYANRVLHDVGLCVCTFDITEAGEGKVKSVDAEGMRLTLGFFDDVYVPSAYLPTPSAFDISRRQHFWVPPGDEEDPPNPLDVEEDRRMYIEAGDQVRVRVESDEFYDDEPGPPKATEGVTVQAIPRRSPYSIICSMSEQGLGPAAWWPSDDGDEEMDDG